MKLSKILMGAIGATMATVALATVTFNFSTGVGFVGKGDVQTAFGWNNAAAQKNTPGVSFTYQASDVYDVECYWETTTGNGNIIVHDITIPKHRNINATIAYDARTHKQVDGFNLTGFNGGEIDDKPVPQVGDACPGNNPGTIIAVTLVSGNVGGLYVTYGTTSVLLLAN
jgi:hypothetical protein